MFYLSFQTRRLVVAHQLYHCFSSGCGLSSHHITHCDRSCSAWRGVFDTWGTRVCGSASIGAFCDHRPSFEQSRFGDPTPSDSRSGFGFSPGSSCDNLRSSPVYQAMRPITVPAAGSPVAANPVSSFYAPAGPLVASPQLAPIPLAPATGVVATGVILLPRYVPGQPLRNVVRAFAP